jgi:hypothetical protein
MIYKPSNRDAALYRKKYKVKQGFYEHTQSVCMYVIYVNEHIENVFHRMTDDTLEVHRIFLCEKLKSHKEYKKNKQLSLEVIFVIQVLHLHS